MKYLTAEDSKLSIKNGQRNGEFDSKLIHPAVSSANEVLLEISEFEVDLFQILGMRNLSALVGEVFANEMAKTPGGQFIRNPHQDGYPDLLLMDSHGKGIFDSMGKHLRDKAPFSPFKSGGVEVKATVGSIPSAKDMEKKSLQKLGIGEQRIEFLKGYDWKAHHRETNNLLGLIWDFISGVPNIVAVFYSSELIPEDWRKVQQPKDGGGRTTSVSVIKAQGRKKMYAGWQCVLDDPRYVDFLNRSNKASLIPSSPQKPEEDGE